jgi:hypothetical protein
MAIEWSAARRRRARIGSNQRSRCGESPAAVEPQAGDNCGVYACTPMCCVQNYPIRFLLRILTYRKEYTSVWPWMDRRIAAQGRARSLRGAAGLPCPEISRPAAVCQIVAHSWMAAAASSAPSGLSLDGATGDVLPALRSVGLDRYPVPGGHAAASYATVPPRVDAMPTSRAGRILCREHGTFLAAVWPSTGAIPVFHGPESGHHSCLA